MSTALNTITNITDAPLHRGDHSAFPFGAKVLSYHTRRELPASSSTAIALEKPQANQIVGNSPALKRVLELVEKVAPFESTVLLLGETGTGKELIANAIHRGSPRRDHTFVRCPAGRVDCERAVRP